MGNLVDAAAGALEAYYERGSDLVDVGDTGARLLNNTPNSLMPPSLEKALGPLNILMDGIRIKNGMDNIYSDDPEKNIQGVHDVIDGGSGLTGSFNPLASAFAGGFAFGDMLGPFAYGSDEWWNRAHLEQMPEDGIFKPTSHDWLIDGFMDLFWTGPEPRDPNTYKHYCEGTPADPSAAMDAMQRGG